MRVRDREVQNTFLDRDMSLFEHRNVFILFASTALLAWVVMNMKPATAPPTFPSLLPTSPPPIPDSHVAGLTEDIASPPPPTDRDPGDDISSPPTEHNSVAVSSSETDVFDTDARQFQQLVIVYQHRNKGKTLKKFFLLSRPASHPSNGKEPPF